MPTLQSHSNFRIRWPFSLHSAIIVFPLLAAAVVLVIAIAIVRVLAVVVIVAAP